jgi:hypothetical protein
MKIKTSELSGKPLDWAVAKCEGGSDFIHDGITWAFQLNSKTRVLSSGFNSIMNYCPSIRWSQAGPIIEREQIRLSIYDDGRWGAERRLFDDGRQAYTTSYGKVILGVGPTPLIAAMRCYVESKLGDEVEVPEELTP